MKVIEFTYTKADGKASNRTVVAQKTPNQFVEGIDVSELTEQEFAAFVAEYNAYIDARRQEELDILNKFSLGKSYRRFSPDKMSEINTIYEAK